MAEFERGWAKVALGLGLFVSSACGVQNPQPEPPSAPSPAPAESAKRQAIRGIQTGDFVAALAAAKRAISDDPRDPEPYFYAGVAQERLSDVPAAISSYREAILLGPHLLEARANLSGLLIDQGRGQEALAIADGGLQTSPEDPSLLINRATALVMTGNAEVARAAFDKAASVVQGDAELNLAFAQLLLQLKDRAAATEQLTLALASTDPRILAAVASGFTALREFSGCVRALDKALSMEDSPGAHVRRAICHHGAGNDDASEQDYLAAIELAPEAPVGYFYYARHLAAVGRSAEAAQALDKAQQMQPAAALQEKIEALRSKLKL